MLEYINNRIKELENIEIEAQANSDWELATKVNFAKCELLDCKTQYINSKIDEQLNKI